MLGSGSTSSPSPHPVFTQLVITALKCHKYDKNIQVTGSAALFYLTNSEYRSEQSIKLRRQVIQVVLNGMESYQEVTVSPHLLWPACFGPVIPSAAQAYLDLSDLCQFPWYGCYPRNLSLARQGPRSWPDCSPLPSEFQMCRLLSTSVPITVGEVVYNTCFLSIIKEHSL